jgi:hypothetical protein
LYFSLISSFHPPLKPFPNTFLFSSSQFLLRSVPFIPHLRNRTLAVTVISG